MPEATKHERPLKSQERTIINRNAMDALHRLQQAAHVIRKGLAPLSDDDIQTLINLGPRSYKKEPSILIKGIRNYVDGIRFGELPSEESLYEMLACLWGWQVCKMLGWEWTWVELEREELAVASPDRAYVAYPLMLLYDNLAKPKEQSNTIAATYNWLLQGDLPDSSLNGYKAVA